MRFALRMVNALVALVTLASALAVLVSDLRVPGYREHYRDAVWFVAAYAAVQGAMLVAFARDARSVRWLALAKTGAAYFFLLNFVSLWPHWRLWTPARYIYQLFETTTGSQLGLIALVFLGRGAFNTVNAFLFTQDWWAPLRLRRPLLGRAVTAVPIALTALCVWAFLQLSREEAGTFSLEARAVAESVFTDLDCDTVRTRDGTTSNDVRQRGEKSYGVSIAYGCALTRVVVHAEDGRVGSVAGPREECCGERS